MLEFLASLPQLPFRAALIIAFVVAVMAYGAWQSCVWVVGVGWPAVRAWTDRPVTGRELALLGLMVMAIALLAAS